MQNRILILIVLMFFSLSLSAQKERKLIREGVKSFYADDYPDSEVSFRKALEIDSASVPASYNMAASLYKQEKYDEARSILQKIAETNTDPSIKAGAFHNIGNSFLKEEKYQESIDAYKNSLMLQPNNQDTKYNLAYALQKLQQQQQQDQNKDQKDQNQDKQNQDKKDQDKQNEDQKKDEQKKEDQDKQQQNDEQKGDKKDQPQPQLKNLSEDEVKNMLEALQQQEKDVKEKVDKKKVKVVKSKTEKDW
jgi:Ca-activated chloride channel family protein